MKPLLSAFVMLILLIAGCGGDGSDPGGVTAAPRTPTATTATPVPEPVTTTPAPPKTDALVVSPGYISLAEANMTKAQAVSTGLFDADVDTGDDSCQSVAPLRWKSTYAKSVDVITNPAGTIVSMGVIGAGANTAQGIGIGNTFQQLRDAIPAASPPEDAGYDQAGIYLQSGDLWLGFLFNVKAIAITESSTITFMEVTRGAKPNLIRDGC